MSDIVEQLRNAAHTYDEYAIHSDLELEAATEIEKLRAERDALREALQGLVTDLDDYPAVARLLDTYEYARAALKGKGDE